MSRSATGAGSAVSSHLVPPQASTADPPPIAHEGQAPVRASGEPAFRPSVAGGAPETPATESTLLGDLGRAATLGGFVLRAVVRHRWLAGATFAIVLGATVAALAMLPRKYRVQVRLLAQRNVVMATLGNPGRTLPAETDTPTRLAGEAVLNRRNLESIVRQARLLETWDETRNGAQRIKDRVRARVYGAPTAQERLDVMVALLERRMSVQSGEGTVTIGVLWPSAPHATEIVLTAQQNFLEERHASEVAAITESIAILEEHATRVHADIEAIVRRLGTVRQTTLAEFPGPVRVAESARGDPPPLPPAVVSLQGRLAGIERTIADLEESRARRFEELQSTLSAQRTRYGPAHPQIMATEESIRAVTTESPQLAALKQQAASILSQLRRAGAPDAPRAATQSAEPTLARAALATLAKARADSTVAERQTYDRSRLKIAVNAYEDLLARLEAARIELETTRAAFKYRYAVLKPPQLPQRAISPRPFVLLAAGTVLAGLLALFVAVVRDVGSGMTESWQIERVLGLRLLGVVPPA